VSGALTLSFHDTSQELHGTVRSGMTLLFDGGVPETIDAEAAFSREDDGWRAVAGDSVDLKFTASVEGVDLGGAAAWLGQVTGTVRGRPVSSLGVATETLEAPRWDDLDALRALAVVMDERSGVLAISRRPRGAMGHGDERITGWLLVDGEARAIEDTRISTIYDGDGRQRKAGLELWMPGEDFPRRASGTARAGASLALEGLRVHAAVFEWEMEGRTGVGSYDVIVRELEPAAA
jgi:hypothetical protein